jgi:hypothetical protein
LVIYSIVILKVNPIRRRSVNITLDMPSRIPIIWPPRSATNVRRTCHGNSKIIHTPIPIPILIPIPIPIFVNLATCPPYHALIAAGVSHAFFEGGVPDASHWTVGLAGYILIAI